jgi:hypothetical protein
MHMLNTNTLLFIPTHIASTILMPLSTAILSTTIADSEDFKGHPLTTSHQSADTASDELLKFSVFQCGDAP